MKLKILVQAIRDLLGTHWLWLNEALWTPPLRTVVYPYYTVKSTAREVVDFNLYLADDEWTGREVRRS